MWTVGYRDSCCDSVLVEGSVIDVGGGASRPSDNLIELNLDRVADLDISERALGIAKARLGARGNDVEWIVADITQATDIGRFDLWHDRAVFHFLTDPPTGCTRLDFANARCRPEFELIDSERYMHTTPSGVRQSFLYTSFRQLAADRESVNI